MQTKIIQFIPALLVLSAIGFRYFNQWCIIANSLCYGTFVHWIYLGTINPAFYFAVFFLPITIILTFVPRIIFQSWLRLAVWFVPLAVIFISFTPDSNPGAIIELFSFYRDDAARLAGGVFSATSLVLIIYKYLSIRHANRNSGQV